MTADLSGAVYLEIAAQARVDGDLPRFLGAVASISPETLEHVADVLGSPVFAALFTGGCPDCHGFGKAMTRTGVAICATCKGLG